MVDKLFRVAVIRKTPNPQQAIAAAMHQDYSEHAVIEEIERGSFLLTEKEAGDRVVKHLLAGGRGHYGPLEHPQIIFNICNFPHSTMQQLRTHRVGCSFDVASGRYTGKRIAALAEALMDDSKFSTDHLPHGYAIGMEDKLLATDYRETLASIEQKKLIKLIESVFYLRPVGYYRDRQGHKYHYTKDQRDSDLVYAAKNAIRYYDKIKAGFSEEHARGQLCFDFRQHFVMSCNVRSLMHILDLRLKKDAQLECQQCCELMYEHFVEWCPEIAAWYDKNRKSKGKLAP